MDSKFGAWTVIFGCFIGACGTSTSPDTSMGTDVPMGSDGMVDGTATDVADSGLDAMDTSVPDAAPGLPGIYQLASVDITGDGGTVHVTNVDTPFSVGDAGSFSARVNGTMDLSTATLSFSLAFAVQGTTPPDHVPVDSTATAMGMARLNATGYGTAGTLDTSMSRFVGVSTGGAAATIALQSNPDGTLTITPFGSADRFNFQRPAALLTGAATLTSNGQAAAIPLAGAGTYLAFASPRVVILWDDPNHGTGYTASNDSAITVTATAGSAPSSSVYAMTFSGSPPAAGVATVAGIPVALGYVVIYDDTNANMQFDIAADAIRGVSTIALGWRGTGTPDSTYATSPVADMWPGGYQVVMLHGYVPPSGVADVVATAADTATPIQLNAPIFNTVLPASTIPDIL